jgi:uncharacterized DUF497 family protein
MQYNFEWDPNKALINTRKHGVSFEEATQVFDDPMALTVFDNEESSDTEDRWVTLGQIGGKHYLVVVHTFRSTNEEAITIRLISARQATKHEIRQYEQG